MACWVIIDHILQIWFIGGKNRVLLLLQRRSYYDNRADIRIDTTVFSSNIKTEIEQFIFNKRI
jgi:hypothetical protein